MKHVSQDSSALQEVLVISDDPTHAPRAERRVVELNGYLIRSSKAIVDIKVLDLSYDGCGIRTLVPLKVGEKVKLSVLGRGSTAATVRWYHARNAGLLFDAARPTKTNWPRKADRVAVQCEASLRRAGRLSFRVRTLDVTRFGCRCEFVDRPSIYERVWIKFDGLESLVATVCWVEDSDLGLMYENEIHPAVFDMLLARWAPEDSAEA